MPRARKRSNTPLGSRTHRGRPSDSQSRPLIAARLTLERLCKSPSRIQVGSREVRPAHGTPSFRSPSLLIVRHKMHKNTDYFQYVCPLCII